MYYELKGTLRELIDECVGRSGQRKFDLGFGLQLTVYRLHDSNLAEFCRRLAGIALPSTRPRVVADLLRDLAVCEGALIFEAGDTTFIYGSPYEFDFDKAHSTLEGLGHLSMYLQEDLNKFKGSHYSAAGQAR